MKTTQYLFTLLFVFLLQTNHVNAQFGKLSKRFKKTSKAISKNTQKVTDTKQLLASFFDADFSTYPKLIKSKPYKEQVRNSGAVSRINKVDQLISLYLRDKSKWETKGFSKYQGFLKARISRLEPGVQGIQESAPAWFMLPFYHKTINNIKEELTGKTAENEAFKQKQYEDELQAKKEQGVADSLAYVQKAYDEFKMLTKERPYKEEEKIVSDFHKKNIGKIVFSKSNIVKDAPSSTKTTNYFTSNDEIYMATYLGKAIRNMYFKPKNVEKELYKDLLLSADNYNISIYIDGKKHYTPELRLNFEGMNEKFVEPLSYYASWHTKKRDGGYTSEDFIEIMRKLPRGKHKIKIVATVNTSINFQDPELQVQAYFEKNRYKNEELWEASKKSIDYKPEAPVFEGEFTINILGPMKSGYKWTTVKTGGLNKSASIKAGIKKVEQKDGSKVIGVKVESDSYGIARNSLTGVILYRYVVATVAFKSKRNGLPYKFRKTYKQRYNGSKYQTTWYANTAAIGGVYRLLDL
ncbi:MULTISPECIES: hypothetical protein [unclassified Tenacibaculum]|uniref:hypothetical protein n=1 Tax=unclassified Tenacibaculum TaxID=2635139 RepID=UPI001F486FE3|nr:MULTISPECIES: hypothetical protein [unclassified Tenacibaculum]MCF2874811.1 hypothetical protein [Tenacibaculum sp. Cn5-1]MCF2934123.1 hypothetical protein [Tenacibaculum sp. Cn5-34]MCG7510333.1 hypothetical protein [Tenacibaculum sp. Cn5-46]